MSFGFLLRRGVAAGAAAGLVAALVSWLLVEPVIRRALVVEEARVGAHGGHQEEPLVSRGMQVAGGMVTAALVGVFLGVIFAVVFARTRHRLPVRTDFGRSVLLAMVGFGVFSLLPGLKYPANPPAVGDSATVTERTLLYVSCIVMGLLVVSTVVVVDRLLSSRGVPAPHRTWLDVLTAVVLLVVVLVWLPPSPDAVPRDVPPSLLWDFRLASLTQLASMWAVFGLSFGILIHARVRRRDAPERVAT